jgi:LysR family transcriptional activator of dmlA
MNSLSMDRGDLELVLAIRDQGSLAGASATLDVVPSVITKRLGALEARLGQRLFERTTRRLSVTAEGEAVCLHAKSLLEGFAALESELGERQNELAGTIRLAATFGFGRRWLGPALATFQARHPGLQIELLLTERLPDLGAEGYDGALWLWAVQQRREADWVTRRIARNQRVLAASPAYIERRGMPATVDALGAHDCLVARENGEPNQRQSSLWTLRHARDGSTARVRVQGPLASNSGEMVRDWCLAGHGIMLRSLWDIAPQLAWRPKTPRRVRLLLDHLAEQFRGEPWRPGKAGTPR